MPSFYERRILPWLLTKGCSTPPVMRLRAQVVPRAAGRVLELGIGGGLNLPFYDPARVESIAAVDPSAELRARAAAASRPHHLPLSVFAGIAESLPFENVSFDSVVTTFTLCSVDSLAGALAEARRVLKPEGRLFFCEHGLAPDADVVRWQHRVEPLWKRVTGGCHITRPITAIIAASGFTIEHRESMYMPRTPKITGWTEWGWAVSSLTRSSAPSS